MDPHDSADRLGLAPRPVPPANRPANPSTNPANPYAAPAAGVVDARDDEAFVKSSRGVRLGATLLDGAFVAAPAMVLAILVPGLSRGPVAAAVGALLVVVVVLGFIAFVVVQVVLLHRRGQTIGKRLAGIRIVRADGSRAGLGRLLGLRSFVPGLIGAIPLVGPLFGLANPLVGQEKRCLHDLIADTIVVDA